MGRFNIFFSFSSNECKEIVEYVCNFNWFLIVVSLDIRILGIFDRLLFIFKIHFICIFKFVLISFKVMIIIIHFTFLHKG